MGVRIDPALLQSVSMSCTVFIACLHVCSSFVYDRHTCDLPLSLLLFGTSPCCIMWLFCLRLLFIGFPLAALPCSCHVGSHSFGSVAFLLLLACFFRLFSASACQHSHFACAYVERSLHSCSLAHAVLFCMLWGGTFSCPALVPFRFLLLFSSCPRSSWTHVLCNDACLSLDPRVVLAVSYRASILVVSSRCPESLIMGSCASSLLCCLAMIVYD